MNDYINNTLDDKLNKILNEYDRLIVETPTKLNIENENIIKIRKFEKIRQDL